MNPSSALLAQRPPLPKSLALLGDLLLRLPPVASTGLADDPLRLDFPPVVGNGGEPIDAQAVRLLADLYLVAELEQTGVITVAELLSEHRAAFDLRSIDAAELLESFALRMAGWYGREQRDQVIARVFGLGALAGDVATLVNRDFERLLVDVCTALGAHEDAMAQGASPLRTLAALRRVTDALRANLALRQYGNTLLAARALGEQLLAAIEVLASPGILALVGGNSLWDVVRAGLEDATPDIGRLVARGQAGQALLRWLADGGPDVPAAAAAQWLIASGFADTGQARDVVA